MDRIDLRSDTVTTPSDAMRDAARDAEVGDDVYGEDPSINHLEEEAAEAVGMEAALYVPTGTMGNQVALKTHTTPGHEVILERDCHVFKWELGGAAQHSGLQTRPVDAPERGVPTGDRVHEAYVEADAHRPGTGLLCLENTHNSRGGMAISPDAIDEAAAAAHALDVPVHLDGARLFNAAVAQDVSGARLCESVDTVMFCLSKGLGAPVGSMLAGPEEFIDRARRNRKLFGGGMRQAGMIAAPGRLALDNVERLADDHDNAQSIADELDGVGGLATNDPDTNIVLVDVTGAGMTAADFSAACEDEGVLVTSVDAETARLVTHLDVSRSEVEEAIERIRAIVA